MRGPGGPWVDFIMVSKRWQGSVEEGQVLAVGGRCVVDGQTCVVLSIAEVAPGKMRAWVEPDRTQAAPAALNPCR